MAMNDGRVSFDQPGDGLSEDELQGEGAVDLPNREAMSLIEPGLGLVEGNVFQPTGTTWDPTETDPNQPLDPNAPQELYPTQPAPPTSA
jgi:hypothetical protein